MPAIGRARTMLSLVPAEVFDNFFKPLIACEVGWPFTSIESGLQGTDWFRILYPFTLRDINQFRWVRRSFLLNKLILHPISQDDIHLVISNKTENVWAMINRDSEPSRRSLAWHSARILSTGCFCAPVTLAFSPDGIKILDGNHRIAALIDLGIQDSIPIDDWIGLLPIET